MDAEVLNGGRWIKDSRSSGSLVVFAEEDLCQTLIAWLSCCEVSKARRRLGYKAA